MGIRDIHIDWNKNYKLLVEYSKHYAIITQRYATMPQRYVIMTKRSTMPAHKKICSY